MLPRKKRSNIQMHGIMSTAIKVTSSAPCQERMIQLSDLLKLTIACMHIAAHHCQAEEEVFAQEGFQYAPTMIALLRHNQVIAGILLFQDQLLNRSLDIVGILLCLKISSLRNPPRSIHFCLQP